MVKKGVKPCMACDNEIDLDNSKYVLLGTYNGKKALEEGYYHFQCFTDWYNSKVTEKAKNTIQSATKVVAGMLGKLRGSSGGEVVDLVQGEIPNMEDEVTI